MNNSPANVAGGGRVGVDLRRLLPGCLRFLSAFLIVGSALAATNASAQGRVYFNMPPVPSPVAEGTAATFTVCPPDESLASAEVEVQETGSMIDGTPPTTVDFTGAGLCADLVVPTMNDTTGEADSVITAEILCPDRAKRNATGGCDATDAAYLPGLFGSHVRQITVEDDDGGATTPPPQPPPPPSEVTIAAGTSPVTEGTAAEFTLTRTGGDLTVALTVTVAVEETGSTISGMAPTTVDFAADSATAMLSVATEDDSMDEPDSDVTATVSAGTGYTVGTASSAMVTVADDDEPPADVPVVTIVADAASVGEGTAAEFTLTRTLDPAAMLTVTVAVDETGSTLSDPAPTTVDFAAGSATATLSVATEDDSLDEPDSTVTVMVSAGADYAVGSPGSAMVTVTDDDMAVDDGDAPKVYFNMGATQVVEGSDATFVLFRQSTNAIVVNVDVKETGKTIKGTAPVTVEFAAGATRAELVVETDDDDAEEDDSVLTATILDGTGYDPGLYGSDMARITVVDNDAPGDDVGAPVDPNLPTAPQGLEPTPGDHSVALVWQAPADDGGGAIIRYEYLCEGGSGCDGTWTEVAGGASAGGVTVMGLDNGRVQTDGSVAGPSYMFQVRAVNAAGDGAASDPVSATPLGPDIEVSIAADMDAVTEGADAVFTLTRIFNPLGVGQGLDHLVEVDVMVTVVESGATISQAPMKVTMDAREPTAKLTVTTDDDMLDEADSEITAEVVDMHAPGYRLDDDPAMRTAAITVMDDDDPPTATIANATAVEGDEEIMFTISLDNSSGKEITVDWTTEMAHSHGDDQAHHGSDKYDMAVADTDYMTMSGSVVFMPADPAASGVMGETEHTISIPVTNDMLDEHDETFTVSISAAADVPVMIADGEMAVGTIEDDDDAPSVSIEDMSGDESKDLVFAVTLDAPSGLPIVLDVMTEDMATPDDDYGMATADVDYTAITSGITVEFVPEAAGMAGPVAGTVTVTVEDDMIDEHDEVFAVTLTPQMDKYVMVGDGTATGTIEDNDDRPTVSIADASGSEGDGEIVFTVSLEMPDGSPAPSGLPISVEYMTGDMETPDDDYGMATAGDDYMPINDGMLDFEPGDTEMTVTVTVVDDMLDEHDEMFAVMLSNASYAMIGGDGTATGTIEDDDDRPTVSIEDASGSEADGQVVFTVSLEMPDGSPAPSGLPISVEYSTGDVEVPEGSYTMATAVDDYMPDSGKLDFAPGDTEMTVTVTVVDDMLDELDEMFAVVLTMPMYATFAGDAEGDTAIGTIEDDDATPTLTIDDMSGNEAVGEMMFPVTLSAPSGLPVSADYATVAGTAMPGEDYEAAMETLNIAPGETSTMVPVTIIADDVHEAEEMFSVELSGAMHSTLDDGSAVGTITDDDPPPTLAIGDSSASESAGQMTFTVTKSGPTALDASVSWATSNGTATAGEDYTSSSGDVTFAPGETSMTISVPITADDRYEGEETFTVTLSGSSNSTLADATATGTITDDDAGDVVQAWLARFGRTVATHVVDAVGGRLTEEPIEASVAQLRLGGYAVGGTDDVVWGGPSRLSMAGQRPGAMGDPLFNPVVNRGFNGGFDPTFGQAWGGGTQGPWAGTQNNAFGNLLSRSSFHFSAAGGNPGDSFALWGRGATTSFSGDDGALSHDGDVTTGTVGADFETGDTLFGIGMSHSQGEGEFAASGSGLAGGNLDSSLTLFHPYVRLNLNECTSIWGLVGTGSGDLTLTNGAGGAAIDTDIEMTMGAAGFRGPLQAGLGDFGLEVKSDVFIANMSADAAPGLESVDADASRARVALQGSNTTELEGGGLFTPMFEAGLRYDGGDAETGAGVEIGGGLRFADASRRVSLQLNARALLAHSESEYEEWGLGASVVVHPNASGQGVTFNLRSAWGEVASGVDAMWSRYDAAALVNRGERSLARRIGARYDAELGYGLNAPGGRNVLVPYVAAGVSDIGTRDYRLGLRLRSDANMDLRFEVDRREGLGFEPDHGVVLRGWLFW